MQLYCSEIIVPTSRRRSLVDITTQVRAEVRASGVAHGLCSLFAQGATAALMVQENADPNIALDVLDCLDGVAPKGAWRHDRIDGNGDAHIQAGLVGPSESVPIREGRLALSTWQNLFLCDFDGPRQRRVIMVTIVGVARA